MICLFMKDKELFQKRLLEKDCFRYFIAHFKRRVFKKLPQKKKKVYRRSKINIK